MTSPPSTSHPTTFSASCEGCPYPDTCSYFRRCTFRAGSREAGAPPDDAEAFVRRVLAILDAIHPNTNIRKIAASAADLHFAALGERPAPPDRE